ncbi:MAG: ankyrin repeat domain-containing protein [Leptospiraceae bacterium]|nr:ankyrin repeat domain-containing protein [Leptospiraceae bacterium]
MQKGANVKANKNNGFTAMHYAASFGNLETVKYLISNGADVNSKDRDVAIPLHYATLGSHLETIKLLVAEGSNVNAKDKDSGTSLHIASRLGNLEVVKFLVSRGANKYIKTVYGKTALDIARIEKNKAVIEFLSGVEIKINSASILDSNNEINNSSSQDNLDSPLHDAAIEGNLEMVKLLISKRTDINKRNKYGNTPLHYASIAGHLEIVKYLLSNGANNLKSNSGKTPLDFARDKEHVEIVSALTAWKVSNTTKKIIINKKKEANDLKKEASNDDKIAKIETNSSDAKWSQYQGSLNWSRAKEKCASLGMRLPTVTELKSAYTAGVIESWKKDDSWYWSSEFHDEDTAYSLRVSDGGVFNQVHYASGVRCIR